MTDDDLEAWRANPATRRLLRHLRERLAERKASILEALWASGQDSPARREVQAQSAVVDWLESEAKAQELSSER